MTHVVLDTNVLVAGLRSRRGSAFELLRWVSTDRLDIHLSVPLVLEYEDALLRHVAAGAVERKVVDDVLDFHCTVARRHSIFFLWRPHLPDPRDEMVLELAVTAGCKYIVTYNKRHFPDVAHFGVRTLTPRSLLDLMEEIR